MIRKLLPAVITLVIALAGIFTAYYIIRPDTTLPVYNPSDVNPELVPEELRKVKRDHVIPAFSFVDQEGKPFTSDFTRGRITLSSFFFVTCPSICPLMATEMKTVYDEFEEEDRLLLLSHTVMPESDSVPVLKRYADSLGVKPARWKFLTGDKAAIYDLARKGYMVVKTTGDGGSHDFIHTENLVLVDDLGRIRGYYDGTSEEDTERVIRDIKLLLRETAERS